MLKLLKIFRKRTPTATSSRLEICISGSGGQGIILTGVILAEAASLYENKNAVQTQSYGPEARGGASRSEVVISEGEIFYPKTIKLDALLALTQEALDKNISRLKNDGILITDSLLVKDLPRCTDNTYSFGFTQIANEKLGNILTANMIALGALITITKAVRLESIQQSMKNRIKKKFWELDNRALMTGFEEANKMMDTTIIKQPK